MKLDRGRQTDSIAKANFGLLVVAAQGTALRRVPRLGTVGKCNLLISRCSLWVQACQTSRAYSTCKAISKYLLK